MTVRKNGDFSFTDKGQIQMIGHANLLNSDFLGKEVKAEFKAMRWDIGPAIYGAPIALLKLVG